MREHWLLKDISLELSKVIEDYDVCVEIGIKYLKIKESENIKRARLYHHECLKDMADNINGLEFSHAYESWLWGVGDNKVSYEILCAHMNKRCEMEIYLKMVACVRGSGVLNAVIASVADVNYSENNLKLKEKLKEINNIKYHMLILCYNNIVLD